MAIIRELKGQKFGKLTAIQYLGSKYQRSYWLWRCDCGKLYKSCGTFVTSGDIVSCGCHRSRRNGLTNTRSYHIWYGMIERCENPKNKSYQNYGGRGITICKRWRDFPSFFKDMGEPPLGLSLDRIDNNRGYSPKNCRWATDREQSNNRRNNRTIRKGDKEMTLSQWAVFLGIRTDTLWRRLRRMSPERALQTSLS